MCIACTTPFTAPASFRLEQFVFPAERSWPSPARPSSSSASILRAASYRPAAPLADIAKLDFGKINPVTGPIFVEGAEPGDALKVTIEMFKPSGFGWTANIPGFGLLADDFKEPALHIWKYYDASLEPALFGTNGRVR
jgi:acetamidase/formamidase